LSFLKEEDSDAEMEELESQTLLLTYLRVKVRVSQVFDISDRRAWYWGIA